MRTERAGRAVLRIARVPVGHFDPAHSYFAYTGARKIGHEHDRYADRLLRDVAADAGGPVQGPEDDHDQQPMTAWACPARTLNMAVNSGEYEYDVALSFAGENRETVEQFAKLLEAEGFTVFYDNWKKADLWGRDLYQHLDEVYSK